MSDQEKADLATMLGDLPELKVLREFVAGWGCSSRKGRARRWRGPGMRALLRSRVFLAVPESTAVPARSTPEKFAKTIAFLKGPACRRW